MRRRRLRLPPQLPLLPLPPGQAWPGLAGRGAARCGARFLLLPAAPGLARLGTAWRAFCCCPLPLAWPGLARGAAHAAALPPYPLPLLYSSGRPAARRLAQQPLVPRLAAGAMGTCPRACASVYHSIVAASISMGHLV